MWEDFWEMVQTVSDVSQTMLFHHAFQELVASERTEAQAQLEQLVRNMDLDQFDGFEQVFLEHSLLLIEPEMRERAMQLYAWVKLLEYDKNGQRFRGFPGSGEAIT